MSRIYWLIFVIAIALGVRYLFAQYFPAYQTSGDSVSYYLTGKNLVEKGSIVDPWRTPIYPLIVIAPFALSGNPMPETLPMSVFSAELWTIRLAQSLSAIVMIVILFFMILELTKSTTIAGVICIFVATNWELLVNEFGIYTEAFSTLWLVVIVRLAMNVLKKFSIGKIVVFVVLCIVGVLLRPFYIGLPIILFGIIIWYHASKHVLILTMYAVIAYCAVFILYAQGNGIVSQYYGVSRISDINLLGKIFQYDLPLAESKDDITIRGIVENFRKQNTIRDPWYVFIQNPHLYNPQYAEGLKNLTQTTIREHIVTYVTKSVGSIPSAMSESVSIPKNIYRTSRYASFFYYVESISNQIRKSQIFIFFTLVIYTVKSFRKKTYDSVVLFCMSLVCLYQVLMSVFFSYEGYTRLLSEMVPISYSLTVILIARMYSKLAGILHSGRSSV